VSKTAPNAFAEHYALRDEELLQALRADLLGPVGGEHELLTEDAPFAVYPVGVLFPQAVAPAVRRAVAEQAAEQDGLDAAALTRHESVTEDAGVDLGVALANLRRPSSMGLTFAVDPTTCGGRITAQVRAAMYAPEDENGLPVAPRFTEARSTERQRERWRRVPLTIEPQVIDVTKPGQITFSDLHPGLELRVLVRKPTGPQNVVAVTATLVNTMRVAEGDLQDAFSFFQPKLELTSAAQDGSLPFVERPAKREAVDAELALSRLLHWHAPSFAVGHGCAAAWDWTPPPIGAPQPQRAAVASVRSEFVPHFEVLLTDSNPEIDDAALTMHGLATRSSEEIQEALRGLLVGYERWIEAREIGTQELAGTEHADAAKAQLELCHEALRRMRRGVALLADLRQPRVLQAFRLANMAMAQQRARTSWVKAGRKGEPEVTSGKWRPFQISFLLLCLEGIVDSNSDDRGVADLLWFPTGGGKTEAYLGLIAFTTFHRRLRDGVKGAGVTVLMRYTLRLLTLQQFERAAALICAMEEIRRQEQSSLGHEPISIGMWVGASATPNKLDRAEKRLEELLNEPGKQLQTENPVQLHACPWCGTKLDAHAYAVSGKRMTVHCPDRACAFHDGEGLPIHLVDEAVYHAHPTLIIATVDKFAAMPWRPETAALFNRDESVDGVRPPELIVQDELHLISGPLGTLTGLYETAVDVLADRPKVIASTATIRRASQQGGALFDRAMAQFPPPCLDSRDSWFAVQTPRERKATRRYVGLLTPSTSQATLLVRIYAALLNRAARSQARPEVRDAYWTLVGYFNSLRLLAAAELQVRDDVADRLEYLAERDASERPRRVEELVELTSRKTASEIPSILKNLERGLPADHVADVLLATNMISVGVDIDRLGLMAVMGQPQTTAEYIQATSRVGRRHPGLIAVMLNSARSRDRSHYESFQGFHSALYREVESTSVTPFSARARDRGLHAVIVALTRILIPTARPNTSAGEIEGFVDEIKKLVRPCVLARVGAVDEALDTQERDATARAFDEFVEDWRYLAEENPNLVYEGKRGALLHGFMNDEADPDAWRTLWSLRDVDAESPFFLDK
jgi:hypothetical protein